MDLSTVYSKTRKGKRMLVAKNSTLSAEAQLVLSKIDGKLSAKSVMQQIGKFNEYEFTQILIKLLNSEYIGTFNESEFFSTNASNAIVVEEASADDFFRSKFGDTKPNKPKPAESLKTPTKQPEIKAFPTTRPVAEIEDEDKIIAEINATIQAKKQAAARSPEELEKARKEEEARRKEQIRLETEAKFREEAKRIAQKKAAETARLKAEAELRDKKEAERLERERLEQEAKAKQEAEAKKLAEEKAREEAEAFAKAEQARIKLEKVAAEAKEKAEREALALSQSQRLEAERLAKEAAEAQAKAESERIQREQLEAEALAKAQAERLESARAQAEAERVEQARLEAELKAKQEAEQKAREEAEAIAKAQAEEAKRKELLRIDAEASVMAHAERLAREQEAAEAKAKAEEKARKEAERKEQKRLDAERKAQEKAEAKARKEAEAKAKADAKAREKAERIEQELLEQEAKARAIAEARAREQIEQAEFQRIEAEARMQAEEEERTRKVVESLRLAREKQEAELRAKEEEEARVIEDARLEAERIERERFEAIELLRAVAANSQTELGNDYSVGASPAGKWIGRMVGIAKVLLGFGVTLGVVLVLLLPRINLPMLTDSIEKIASDNFGEPVNIQSTHLSFLPKPGLVLEDVSIGALSEVKVRYISVSPELSTIKHDVKKLDNLSFLGMVIKKEDLKQLQVWINTTNKLGQLKFNHVAFKETVIDIGNKPLPAFDADVELTDKGEFKSAAIKDEEETLEVLVAPRAEAFDVSVNARGWRSPLGAPILFDTLVARGVADLNQLDFNYIKGEVQGGTFEANVRVNWQNSWRSEGKLTLSKLKLTGPLDYFPSAIYLTGTLDADATFSSEGDLVNMLDTPAVNARFTATNGSIQGIDLLAGLRTNKINGDTDFDTFAGTLTLQNGSYQYKQLSMKSGAMRASGAVNIQPDKTLSGRASVNVSAKSRQVNGQFNLGGTTTSPMSK